ncbi:MAG: hypothetical protein MJ252_19750, partial [archaeon]|nr:hypothetical protein [archaeon]
VWITINGQRRNDEEMIVDDDLKGFFIKIFNEEDEKNDEDKRVELSIRSMISAHHRKDYTVKFFLLQNDVNACYAEGKFHMHTHYETIGILRNEEKSELLEKEGFLEYYEIDFIIPFGISETEGSSIEIKFSEDFEFGEIVPGLDEENYIYSCYERYEILEEEELDQSEMMCIEMEADYSADDGISPWFIKRKENETIIRNEKGIDGLINTKAQRPLNAINVRIYNIKRTGYKEGKIEFIMIEKVEVEKKIEEKTLFISTLILDKMEKKIGRIEIENISLDSNYAGKYSTMLFNITAYKNFVGDYIIIKIPNELKILLINNNKYCSLKNTEYYEGQYKCEIDSQNNTLNISNLGNLKKDSETKFEIYVEKLQNYYKETSSFEIYTYSSDNILLQKNENDMTLKFEEGLLENFSVIPSSEVNNEICNYKIEYISPSLVPINSKIYIKFPPEIQVPSNISGCTLNNESITCEENNHSVIITVNKNIQENEFISINIPQIQNPRSLQPSSNFIIYTKSYDEYPIYKSKENVFVKNKIPINITYLQVEPSSDILSTSSKYKVNIRLPEMNTMNDDILYIIIPSQLKISENPKITPLESTNISNYEFDENIIKIKSPSLSGTTLLFQIEDLINPSISGNSDIFKIYIETKDGYKISEYNGNYSILFKEPIIEEKESQPEIIFMAINPNRLMDARESGKINFNIETSKPLDLSNKLSIILPKEISLEGTPVLSILNEKMNPNSKIEYNDEIKEIILSDICKDTNCNSFNFAVDNLKQSLNPGYLIADNLNVSLLNGAGEILSSKIQSVEFECIDCIKADLNEDGNLCKNNMYLLGQSCYYKCPSGYYENSTECSKCDETCLECKEDAKKCTKCAPNYYLSNGNCLEECENGDTISNDKNKCITPHSFTAVPENENIVVGEKFNLKVNYNYNEIIKSKLVELILPQTISITEDSTTITGQENLPNVIEFLYLKDSNSIIYISNPTLEDDSKYQISISLVNAPNTTMTSSNFTMNIYEIPENYKLEDFKKENSLNHIIIGKAEGIKAGIGRIEIENISLDSNYAGK